IAPYSRHSIVLTSIQHDSRLSSFVHFVPYISLLLFFFFNDPATTEIYTLSLHDALPIFRDRADPHRTLPCRTERHAAMPGQRRAAPGLHQDRDAQAEEERRHHSAREPPLRGAGPLPPCERARGALRKLGPLAGPSRG